MRGTDEALSPCPDGCSFLPAYVGGVMGDYRVIVSFTRDGPYESFTPADDMTREQVFEQAKRMLKPGVRSVVTLIASEIGIIEDSIIRPDALV